MFVPLLLIVCTKNMWVHVIMNVYKGHLWLRNRSSCFLSESSEYFNWICTENARLDCYSCESSNTSLHPSCNARDGDGTWLDREAPNPTPNKPSPFFVPFNIFSSFCFRDRTRPWSFQIGCRPYLNVHNPSLNSILYLFFPY